jgi:RNA ligase
LIFDKQGNIIRRGFHKFFNLNEKEETRAENFAGQIQARNILQKVDGSMVTPFYIDGCMRWGTKMGITEVSMAAEYYVADHPHLPVFGKNMLDAGYTPIFEWCDPKKPIVVKHRHPEMVLLAARHMVTGEYIPYHELRVLAERTTIPVVKCFESDEDLLKLCEHTSALEGAEGYVIRLDNGHMFKIKGEWYLKIHRVKDDISSDRKLVMLILDEKVDDLLATVDDNDVRERIEMMRRKLSGILLDWHFALGNALFAIGDTDSRKEYALKVKEFNNPLLRSVLFTVKDGKDETEYLKNWIYAHCSTDTKYTKAEEILRHA